MRLAALTAASLLVALPVKADAIDTRVEQLLQQHRVAGLGLAVIRDGQLVRISSYGKRDVERDLPLTPDTVMYGASLTKATFAYFVLQLVDEGRIELDRSIADLLPQPLPDYGAYADLADDPRWRALTPRILLNHTSGFQNFRWLDDDKKLRFHRDPGARYGYSGEGINLLQFVIERGLGLDVGQEMQRRIFDRFGMTRTAMTWRDDFADNAAQGYTEDGTVQPHRRRRSTGAAGSMDTTLRDWSVFLAAVARGDGLSPHARAEVVRLQVEIDSVAQFPTLRPWRTDAYKSIRLGYALGWGVFETPHGHAFFKEGHDDDTANYALCIDAKRDCILLLSNSVRAEEIFKPVTDLVMGELHIPWRWENYASGAAAPDALR
ncbi:serine hydrolase domain-containing protein [Roseiterribacter gracilis]|uniref:Beta-lactamase-related domain-containing protein n=1 Tax=Roseiterribacter gracilis TaxID=2812848 RepID=A0A8S8XDS1_9PROT|nr:hypothetical protein TMPK1_38200 [Rhodospirillales bacterium TMPK1]